MSSDSSVRLRAMLRAAELSGGMDELAARLNVTPALLSGMMKRHLPVPEKVFLRVVDIFFNGNTAGTARAPGGGAVQDS